MSNPLLEPENLALTMSRYQTAKMQHVSWEASDVPRSSVFDDTFYTSSDGQAETAYVFIDGNRLPERWAGSDEFSIAELGFGTGLNFLETWRRWIAVRSPAQQLVFTSFEAYPISADDMARALSRWETLKPLSSILVSRWREAPGLPVLWQLDVLTRLEIMPGKAEQSL